MCLIASICFFNTENCWEKSSTVSPNRKLTRFRREPWLTPPSGGGLGEHLHLDRPPHLGYVDVMAWHWRINIHGSPHITSVAAVGWASALEWEADKVLAASRKNTANHDRNLHRHVLAVRACHIDERYHHVMQV